MVKRGQFVFLILISFMITSLFPLVSSAGNSTAQVSLVIISQNASLIICGNGILGGTEECDDGNLINGDGCSSVCTIESPSPTRGGGGGGGPTVSSEELDLFSVSPLSLIENIKQGGTDKVNLVLTNLVDRDLDIVIDYSKLDDFVVIRDTTIKLKAGESRIVPLEFFISKYTPPNSYFGNIYFDVKGEDFSRKVGVSLNVKEIEPLVEIDSRVINKTVFAGSSVNVEINLTNFVDKDINVNLSYGIVDFDNKTDYYSNSEIISLKDNLSLVRSLDLPKDIDLGNYLFYSNIKYSNKSAFSSDYFRVVRRLVTKIFFGFIIIILLLIIFLIIFLYYRYWRKKYFDKNYLSRR